MGKDIHISFLNIIFKIHCESKSENPSWIQKSMWIQKPWHDLTRNDYDTPWHTQVWHGTARHDTARATVTWHGTRPPWALYNQSQHNKDWFSEHATRKETAHPDPRLLSVNASNELLSWRRARSLKKNPKNKAGSIQSERAVELTFVHSIFVPTIFVQPTHQQLDQRTQKILPMAGTRLVPGSSLLLSQKMLTLGTWVIWAM